MRMGLLLSIPLWAVIIWSLTGCGAMGVKNVDLWGAKMEFSEGAEYRVGFNSIDEVDDRKALRRPARKDTF